MGRAGVCLRLYGICQCRFHGSIRGDRVIAYAQISRQGLFRFARFSFLIGSIIVCPTITKAKQEASMEQPQKTELEKKAEEIKLLKQIAEDEKAIRAAQTPAVNPLDGKLEIDDKVRIEATLLTYRALERIAGEIAESVRQVKEIKTIWVTTSENIFDNIYLYESAFNYLTSIKDRYDTLLKEEKGKTTRSEFATESAAGLAPAILAATTTLKSIIDIASLFRTDITIKGVQTDIDDAALVAAVAGKIKTDGSMSVVYDKLTFMPHSKLNELIGQLLIMKIKAESVLHAPDSQMKSETVAALKVLNAAVDSWVAQSASPGENNLYARLRRGEILKGMLDNGAYVLYLKTIAAGGANRTSKNLFTGSSLYHSGGAVVSYFLLNSTGAVVSAKNIGHYGGFIKLNKKTADLD